MENESQSFLNQLGSLWARLNSSEKLIIVASVLILAVALIVWISVARTPAMALLYGSLDPADAGQVVSELESKGITYSLKDNGQSILVPADQVDSLRLDLASGGFAPTGTTGYEILDESPMGMSDFLQRTRRTQAIEGELSRTLMSLDEVAAARVHLTIPQPTPFIAEQTDPVASVVLQLSPPGARLSRDKIAAVRTFVSGAIGALDADNVTIIDQNMNLLTGPASSQPGSLLPTQEEARRNFEMERAADIRTILEPVYGYGKVAVSFSCQMDFDQVQQESLTYEPVSGTDHGVLVSEERTEDSTSSQGSVAPVGIPGTESQIPSYVGTDTTPFETDSATETKNYETSSMHEIRTQAPGTILSCSVGVVIDSMDTTSGEAREILQSEITEVQDLVASAAGLDTTGTDNVTVIFRPFDTSLQAELAAHEEALKGEDFRNFAVKLGIALLVLFIFWMVLKNFLKPVEGGLVMAGAVAGGGESRFEGEDVEIELPEVDPETLEKLKIREEIEKLIVEDPIGASKVIKTWLKE